MTNLSNFNGGMTEAVIKREGITYVGTVSERARIVEYMGIIFICDPNMSPQMVKVITNKDGKEECQLINLELT